MRMLVTSMAALTALLVAAPGAATSAVVDDCGTYDGRGCAPMDQRVDLAVPQFSHSTTITNPLFPISELHSALLLGHVDGKRFRTETTLLPGTQTLALPGRTVEVLVSQYVAYSGRRLEEVALDHYAQADDGSVWYLGEDVYDYRHGTVAFTEGTWRAGRDGPPAMIMPATPRVGDAFRTENVPGVVFEEVTVSETGRTVRGPTGPVPGGLVVDELHADRTHEAKLFAPGYGEFRTAGGGDLEALAMAVPTDARSGAEPAGLRLMATSSEGTLESARLHDWKATSSTVRRLRSTWRTVRADRPPWRVAARMDRDLAGLALALDRRDAPRVAQRAIDVWQSVLDLQLRYRSPAQVDLARMHLWTQQLRVLAAAHDLGGVTGAVATLEWIRDRVTAALTPGALADLDSRLRDLRSATDAGNVRSAADHAARLGATLLV
jgi:hypothetical protein